MGGALNDISEATRATVSALIDPFDFTHEYLPTEVSRVHHGAASRSDDVTVSSSPLKSSAV